MEIVKMKLSALELNSGQIEGLPVNPRQWTQSDIDSLALSLKETPELFEARPIIAVPHGDKFVILGGNLRYEASRKNKAKEVPCVILPAETPVDKLKEIVIKDNGSWGAWDYDALANEWDNLPLSDWGVSAWDTKKPGEEEPLAPDAGAEQPQEENLPEELQGVDLAPDDMQKFEGDDETAMERIIITYPKEKESTLATLLHLDAIDKVVYRIEELIKEE